MEVKVTEVSLSFRVTRPPTTRVLGCMPYFVNTMGDDVERVVPASPTGPDPLWIDDPHPGMVRFVYSADDVPDVECSYVERTSMLTFHGIRYKHVEQFNEHVTEVLRVLDTESSGLPVTKYKAVAMFRMRTDWDPDAMADIITNDPEMAQVMALCERTSTIGARRLFSAVLLVTGHSGDAYCRAAITYRENNVLAMMSKLQDEDSSLLAAAVLKRLFELYEVRVGLPEQVVDDYKHEVTGIEALREKLPELFVHNYTRECPVLPVMLSFSEAERQRQTKRVILYPSEGKFARYYTAPEGHFVGLKRNRLENRDRFPCLVTCYLQDHMMRRGSETHRYYNEIAANFSVSGKRRPLPKSIQDPNYRRNKAPSFLNAVEGATGAKLESFRWLPQLVKQEMWDWSDDDIMSKVASDNPEGSLVYRYFEEVIGVSIHVVVIRDGNFESLVPRHKGSYVWEPPYSMHIVVFETHRTTYKEKFISYDYLTKDSNTLFDENDPVVRYLIAQKRAISVPLPVIENFDSVFEQTIDRNGKCASVTMHDGSILRTYTRPLAIPVTLDPVCFVDSHMRKMNDARREMGLAQIDMCKRSNTEVLYFPNDKSFRHVRRPERTTSEGLFQEAWLDSRHSEELPALCVSDG